MARYVVLSFEDNEKAEAFINFMQSDTPMAKSVGATAEVIALIAQPTQFHGASCPGSGKRVQPWSRGKKYGWWVCTKCFKPARPQGGTEAAQGENLMRQTVSQGVNLIEDAPNQYASVFDRGWGALGRGKTYPYRFPHESYADFK